ncbi:MAG: DUF4407 domain-containing protein, partial [Ignavibacteria bacterium]|nr:DUF4407 domain-containing protein [Ignavibacteria bacterium]
MTTSQLNNNKSYQNMENNKNKSITNTSLLNKLDSFFLWVANTDTDILKECPQFDKNKQVVTGITLLLLYILSFTSCYFAVTETSIFNNNLFFQLLISFIISSIIFTIDRYIVSSLILNPNEPFYKKIFNIQSIVRLVLSVIIGIIISNPFELKILEDKINNYTLNQKQSFIEKINTKNIEDVSARKDIDYLEKKLNELKKEKENIIENITKESKIADTKNLGYIIVKITDNENKIKYIRNYTQRGKTALSLIQQYNEHLSKINQSIETIQAELTAKKNRFNQKIEQDKNYIKELEESKQYGFLEKNEILSKLKETSSSVFYTWLFIISFFVLIDILPTLIKILSKGKYELIIYYNYQQQSAELNAQFESFKENQELLVEQIKRENRLKNIQNEKETLLIENQHKEDMLKSQHHYETQQLHLENELEKLKQHYIQESTKNKLTFESFMDDLKQTEEHKKNMVKVKSQHEYELEKLKQIK